MYIKNGKNKIKCTDFVSNNPNSVLFYLSTEPKLTKTNTTIELYDDSNFMMTSINRRDYKNEKISKFGEEYILTLTNEEEIIPSLDDYKNDKIKELSTQTEEAITNGFDLEVNGTIKHFSLEAHDQRNILNICQYLYEHQDVPEYMYHADDEEFQLYSRDVIFNIRDEMIHRIIVYNADYSIAKQKIKEAKTIDDVKNISL